MTVHASRSVSVICADLRANAFRFCGEGYRNPITAARAFSSEMETGSVKKTRQIKNLEPRFDSIETDEGSTSYIRPATLFRTLARDFAHHRIQHVDNRRNSARLPRYLAAGRVLSNPPIIVAP
jgi:hypothetical protein